MWTVRDMYHFLLLLVILVAVDGGCRSGDSGGQQQKRVEVKFKPSFNGTVTYEHLGPDNATSDQAGNATTAGGPRQKKVEVVFHPSFEGSVSYHHLRHCNDSDEDIDFNEFSKKAAKLKAYVFIVPGKSAGNETSQVVEQPNNATGLEAGAAGNETEQVEQGGNVTAQGGNETESEGQGVNEAEDESVTAQNVTAEENGQASNATEELGQAGTAAQECMEEAGREVSESIRIRKEHAAQAREREIQVIFHPSFDGSVFYEHFRVENETSVESMDNETMEQNATQTAFSEEVYPEGNVTGLEVECVNISRPARGKEVKVIFYPSFEGQVVYEHLRVENETGMEGVDNETMEQNATQASFSEEMYVEGNVTGLEVESANVSRPARGKEVKVIFYPSFEGQVVYEHFRVENESEVEEQGNETVSGGPQKEVEVVFYPSFNGSVTYNHLGPENITGQASEGKQQKPVEVVFYPSFDGSVIYQHFRDDQSETEEKANETVAEPKKNVEVLFYPSFGGSVSYHHFRAENESGSLESENATEQQRRKEVNVVFHPSFSRPVSYHHFRSEESNSKPEPNGIEGCNASVTPKATGGSTCIPAHLCYNDTDCFGGRCLGFSAGKCNCGACISLLPCQDDRACGGLKGACNPVTKCCDCIRGFHQNGFGSYLIALRDLCNVKDCTGDSNSCFGLPCHAGFCACKKPLL